MSNGKTVLKAGTLSITRTKAILGIIVAIILIALAVSGCQFMSRAQKGAVIGTAGGGAVGALVGKAAGKTAMGAIISVTADSVTGGVFGKQMDKQAA